MKNPRSAIVCVGIAPIDGCGVELTFAERRQFGEVCEHCMLDWQERVRAWRFGGADRQLDELYGASAQARRDRAVPDFRKTGTAA